MGRPLKVGIQLPEVEYEPRWSELAAMARLAEDVGLDSIWVGDHYLYRDAAGARGPWEAWTQLAALAAVTSRVALGPLVAATAFHQPAVLAKLAATVDEISGGRLVLGLGAGWNDVEFAAFGFPGEQRIARFEEAFTIVRTLLREGHIDFDGRFYQLRDCELLPRGPRPEARPCSSARAGRGCCASRCRGRRLGTPGTRRTATVRLASPPSARSSTPPAERWRATRTRSSARSPPSSACRSAPGGGRPGRAAPEGTPGGRGGAARPRRRRRRTRAAGDRPDHAGRCGCAEPDPRGAGRGVADGDGAQAPKRSRSRGRTCSA